ncbi:HPr kinase/phosphatase C-terminal domain-containing protein [Tistrella bauzanensis]|jgi:serine kinase of HPr protein (carbohydrate metabolism regulator)|uniref:HPr kinase/phosphatase C-terminal domain-containing protein n=1 Tax=Tistrella arctica TaxID=3133430 RepID=A0ABU9YKH0_9PROT
MLTGTGQPSAIPPEPPVPSIHATCVRIAGAGVLLIGDSGVGKSDLALRLIDAGAELVADDRVIIRPPATDAADEARWPVARAPRALFGLIEVRGVGILRVGAADQASVRLVALLRRPGHPIERLPGRRHLDLAGIAVPVIDLVAVEASAPARLRAALSAEIDPARRHA